MRAAPELLGSKDHVGDPRALVHRAASVLRRRLRVRPSDPGLLLCVLSGTSDSALWEPRTTQCDAPSVLGLR